MVTGLREGENNTEGSRKSLERYFKSFGRVVRTQIIRDHLTGRSKGYGFVTFKNSKVVEKILSSLNHAVDGNNVKVSLALKTVTKSGEISGAKDDNAREKEERKIFVSGLRTGVYGTTTDNDLKEYFSGFGDVEEVKIVASKSYGFVTFKTTESVKEVLSKRLHSIAGWKINVDQPLRREDKNTITRRVKRTVNVYTVSSDTSDDELVRHFLTFGEVEKVLRRDSVNKHSYQCMVMFKTELGADMATEKPVQELASGEKLYVTQILNNISKTLLLYDTPANITLEVLQLYFEQFGQISRMDLTSDHYRSTHVNIHGVMFRTRPGLPTIEFQYAAHCREGFAKCSCCLWKGGKNTRS